MIENSVSSPKKLKAAQILDPSKQQDRSRIFFGACVTIADNDDLARTITIVGDDETDASIGRIGWNAPLSIALRGARVGDVKTVTLPTGPKEWEVVRIDYPLAE